MKRLFLYVFFKVVFNNDIPVVNVVRKMVLILPVLRGKDQDIREKYSKQVAAMF